MMFSCASGAYWSNQGRKYLYCARGDVLVTLSLSPEVLNNNNNNPGGLPAIMTLARNGLAVTRPNATLDTPLAAALLLRARSLGIWEIRIQLGPIIKLAASISLFRSLSGYATGRDLLFLRSLFFRQRQQTESEKFPNALPACRAEIGEGAHGCWAGN